MRNRIISPSSHNPAYFGKCIIIPNNLIKFRAINDLDITFWYVFKHSHRFHPLNMKFRSIQPLRENTKSCYTNFSVGSVFCFSLVGNALPWYALAQAELVSVDYINLSEDYSTVTWMVMTTTNDSTYSLGDEMIMGKKAWLVEVFIVVSILSRRE